ncbi:MAG: OmpA family protein [Saprospiraceae bacterium]|nr:OmpA family protein [Saprospiraceae bacterium]
MKTRFLTCCFVLVLSVNLLSQTPQAKNAVSFKWAWIDHHTPQLNFWNGDWAPYEQLTSGAEISYTRWLNRSLNLNIPVRLGTADLTLDSPKGKVASSWLSLDAILQLKLLDNDYWINPYLLGGIGGVTTNWEPITAQVPLGAGLNVRIYPNFYLNSQAEYRLALDEGIDNMQFLVGMTFFLGDTAKPPVDSDGDGIPDLEDLCPLEAGPAATKGCPDADGDGISDKDDLCPKEAGSIAMKGCPDSDNDGIADLKDECPKEAGSSALMGCPDKDKDGIADKNDRCPDIAGSINLKGCPDRDSDGVADLDDNCPDVVGPASNKGCPVDSDGDGVPDKDDRCPDVMGPASNKGCPELKEEEKKIINLAIQNVQFETNSATLTKDSYGVLDQLAEVLVKNPAYSCDIAGHTDATGSPTLNQSLSERRAQACYDYLKTKGIDAKRLSHIGYGQTKPVGDNKTSVGRKQNRRTEFDLKVK